MCEDRLILFGQHFPPPRDQPDVVIIPTCCLDHRINLPTLDFCVGCYKDKRPDGTACSDIWPNISFDEGLRRTKFMFTPRGCGPLTYRMLEAIGGGAIPVFTGRGTLMPYAGEGHLGRLWAKCVVHVPMEHLSQMTSRLRNMSDTEYKARLIACAQISALRSHTVGVLSEQAICIVLARVAAALRLQVGSDGGQQLPAWLQGPMGRVIGSSEDLLHHMEGALHARTLLAQCSRVGVHLRDYMP